MEKISKKNLEHLLDDLYDIFNPEHKQYAQGLSEKYIDMPMDAVDMILFKYNQPHQDFHDPQMNGQEYQMQLIANYAKGIRSLQELDISKRRKEIQSQKDQEFSSKQQEEELKQKALQEKLAQQAEGLKTSAINEIAEFKKEAEKLLEELRDLKKIATAESDVQYEMKINYKAEEIVLPNAKRIAGLGIDARIIAKSKSGRPIGLIVKDITYDDISHPEGKTIITIILDKG